MDTNETEAKLHDFFESAHAPGALDAKTKELLHIALLLALRCESSAVSHFAVARSMGITDAELDEVVQLAAAVGAGSIAAMAKRARKTAETERTLWGPKREGEV